MLIPLVNQILAVLTVSGQIIIVLLFVAYCVPRYRQKILSFAGTHFLPLTFVVALTAGAGSLFYSEIAGYAPCKLCWLQRIFMYPQIFLLGVALWKKDRAVADYSLLLSVIGGTIAAYHYLLQIGIAPPIPCSAVGVSVSCSQRFVMLFGYITIPMMALTAFALLLIFAIINKKYATIDSKI